MQRTRSRYALSFIAHLAVVPAASARADTTSATTALTLEALIEEALAHSRQVAVDEAKIADAKALYSFAQAQAYPVSRAQFLFGGPTPEAQTTVQNDITTITESSFNNGFSLKGQLGVALRLEANLFQPLYTFEKITKGKSAAQHLVKAAKHQKTATEAEVAVNVSRAYWTCQLTRSLLDSLKSGRRTLKGVLSRIEDLLDAESPQVTENDRLRLKYALATLDVRRAEASQANQLAEAALRLLLGRNDDAPLVLVEADLEDIPDNAPDLNLVLSAAQAGRPELRALREVVNATQEFAELRQAQFLPDIFLGGQFTYAYTSNATDQTNPFINDPFNFVTVILGLGVRVELDIVHKLAHLERAEAQARIRQSQAALAEQAVELDVRRIHSEITGGYARIRELEKAHRTARGWLTASTLAYDIGTGQTNELVDAFLAWATAEGELKRIRFEVRLNYVELARATGKLAATAL